MSVSAATRIYTFWSLTVFTISCNAGLGLSFAVIVLLQVYNLSVFVETVSAITLGHSGWLGLVGTGPSIKTSTNIPV